MKVIYALNTRNDEHEVILKSVFDQHEKEKQRFLMDMEVKFENFKYASIFFYISFFFIIITSFT